MYVVVCAFFRELFVAAFTFLVGPFSYALDIGSDTEIRSYEWISHVLYGRAAMWSLHAPLTCAMSYSSDSIAL